MIKIDINKAFRSGASEIENELNIAQKCLKQLQDGTGKGNEFLGWIKLPSSITKTEIDDIQKTAVEIRKLSEIVVIVGIGGSYLGARAVIEALTPAFNRQSPEIIYAGHHLDSDYYAQLLQYLKGKKWSIVIISKSGTTTEPAVAFRLLRKAHIEQFGMEQANKLTVAITDKSKGALRRLANENSFKTYIIPDDIGGRYSVLTPVGLLPIAIAGIDIKQLIDGAIEGEKEYNVVNNENQAVIYAAARNKIYSSGKKIEMLVSYHPQLLYFIEWWKQLYGESEGKENKGIFVSGATFTTDLHSLGQYIQQGERHLFETVLSIESVNSKIFPGSDPENIDGLNYLADKNIHQINQTALKATILAHTKGGVPNIVVSIEQLNAFSLGKLIYFFEIACGISGYMLGVNPFDQPGVEDYKVNMFALLGKPGFEKQKEELEKLL
ncbi:MAG TPA: glucose-6-phosphate isomerase [Salinivirgaceae bacterium]|nr:glucose-6-phosphate isomerase [Salinivirgaceae bacterium]HQA75692.1 glucose-6-phosphate isomerase [Salinivirgaceae bacterium]